MKMNVQTKWGWEIAIYLFLAGLGAGAYATGVLADIRGWSEQLAKIGVFLGTPCVLIGCIFLILDLGTPANFWRAAMRPSTSWIARGTIIIVVFMIIDAIHTGFWVWPFGSVLENAETGRQVLGVIGSIFAIGVMVYTGILLGAARPIAFWSTSMLPLLFLVSATSTGIMSIMLVGSFMGAEAEALHRLTQIDIIFLILEILVLIFFLQATHRVTESRESAMVVLTGAASGMFWFGVALLGILVPLILELFVGGSTVTTIIAAICGIIGGLFLRKVILQGGILAPLKAGIFSFAVPSQS